MRNLINFSVVIGLTIAVSSCFHNTNSDKKMNNKILKKIVLREGIEERLGDNATQTVLLRGVGLNDIENKDGSKREALSFYISLGETGDWQLMEVGNEFSFENLKWKVVSIEEHANNEGRGSKNTVTVEEVSK